MDLPIYPSHTLAQLAFHLPTFLLSLFEGAISIWKRRCKILHPPTPLPITRLSRKAFRRLKRQPQSTHPQFYSPSTQSSPPSSLPTDYCGSSQSIFSSQEVSPSPSISAHKGTLPSSSSCETDSTSSPAAPSLNSLPPSSLKPLRNPVVNRMPLPPPQTSSSDSIHLSSTTHIPVAPVFALSCTPTYINVLPRTSPLQINLRSTELELAAASEADSYPCSTFK